MKPPTKENGRPTDLELVRAERNRYRAERDALRAALERIRDGGEGESASWFVGYAKTHARFALERPE